MKIIGHDIMHFSRYYFFCYLFFPFLSYSNIHEKFGYVEHLTGGIDTEDGCIYKIYRDDSVICPHEYQSYVFDQDIVVPNKGAVLKFVPLDQLSVECVIDSATLISKNIAKTRNANKRKLPSNSNIIDIPFPMTAQRAPADSNILSDLDLVKCE